MSPKELSYIDDCLGHLEFMDSLCSDLESELDNREMNTLTKNARMQFQKQFKCLYKLLQGDK
ncbi:MAG: hypothetical protein E7191_08895 [Erysipelotrichaceae bacterium]|nr:hypothetical protein [Erysipelotrichaceae bacterium]MBR3692956.1 hypothetical protein [Erysipelotrichales bacterium]